VRRTLISIGVVVALLGAVAPARAQITRRIAVPVGSPADKALDEITATTDAAQKQQLMEKFLTENGQGDLALIIYDMYIQQYDAAKDDNKVIEYGEKALAIDPDRFSSVVSMVRAAQDKADSAKVYDYAERAGQIVQRYKAKPAPQGMEPKDWQAELANNIAGDQDAINYVEYAFFAPATQTADPAARAALLLRYAAAFPDSSYTEQSLAYAAVAYQQAQNYPKMLETAQGLLAKDPNNVDMLVLLADYDSDAGKDLKTAQADAQKAVDILASAKRPDDVTEDEWQKRTDLQKGLASSALGQVFITQGNETQALTAFKTAAPLLKSNPFAYARNQYRMGFALINLKRNPEAKAAFAEAAKLDTPYKKLAQDKMDEIAAARPAKKN